jgi:uncharacterized DUF497 family protein
VKKFNWNNYKNKILKEERKICFEDIVHYINNGNLLTTLKHPNSDKYNKQKIFIVKINKYAYAIPFIETKDEIFLKTIFPSRKYTKLFLSGDEKK